MYIHSVYVCVYVLVLDVSCFRYAEALHKRSLFSRVMVLRDVFIDLVVVAFNIPVLKTQLAVVLITVRITHTLHCSVPCYM